MSSPGERWDGVYATVDPHDVSWYQERPATSVRLITQWSSPSESLIDVGAGASTLVDELIDNQWTDVTVMDVSCVALALTKKRLGERATGVSFVTGDLRHWDPGRTFRAWHDRAVFHFLDADERRGYVALAERALAPGGVLILAVFAPDGPESCSGLQTTRYDGAELSALFKSGFNVEHCEREIHVTPAGFRQPFTWIVLRRRSVAPGTTG